MCRHNLALGGAARVSCGLYVCCGADGNLDGKIVVVAVDPTSGVTLKHAHWQGVLNRLVCGRKVWIMWPLNEAVGAAGMA